MLPRVPPRETSIDEAITPARNAALDALARARKSQAIDEALEDELRARPLMSAPDRALAKELSFGVLRWQRRLDDALLPHCRSGLPKETGVLEILRMAALQLLFLDRIPPHAAVSTATEAAKRKGFAFAAKFVNAALRALSSQAPGIRAATPPPAGASIAALAKWHSFADWMVEGFSKSVGETALPSLLEASNRNAPLTLRARDREAVLLLLREAGLEASPATHAREGIVLPSGAGGPVVGLPGFAGGAFAVQDEAAQLVTDLLGITKGDELLDVCAAPGGKAIHAAHRGARVTAVDADPRRLNRIREAAKRLGAELTLVHADVKGEGVPGLEGKLFSRVLVDAPCSATGIVRRKPDVKWSRLPSEIARLSAKQKEILAASSVHVAPEGRLVYAVCSLLRDEGEDVIEAFLAGPGSGFKRVDLKDAAPALGAFRVDGGYFRARPDLHGTDGFFAAVLSRI